MVTPLFTPGSVAQNVSKDFIITDQPDEVKRNYRFLWGVGLSIQAKDWPVEKRMITVLRDPISRFFSLLYYLRTVAPKSSFWECELLANCASIDQFIDRYLKVNDKFLRSQFSDILSYMDYSGLEWFHNPQVYTENRAFEELSNNQVIDAVRSKYESVYLIEFQEESAFQFAMKYSQNASRLSLGRPVIVRHENALPKWTESGTSDSTMQKIRHLLRDELSVYEHFKADFLSSPMDSVFENSAYHAIKAYSIRLNSKIHQDFFERKCRYTPPGFFEKTAAPQGLRIQLNNKRLHYFHLTICSGTSFLDSTKGRFVVIGMTPRTEQLVRQQISPIHRERLLGFVKTDDQNVAVSFCDKPVYGVGDLQSLLSIDDIVIGLYDGCWVDFLRQMACEDYVLNDVYISY